MRRSTLLLALVLGACGETEVGEYVVIDGFLARSPMLSCEVVSEPGELAVSELRTATDTTVLVLDRPSRRLVELDATLRPVWELRPPPAGPGAMEEPVSVALVGDTAVAMADQRGLRLVIYARTGELLRETSLGFAPSSLAGGPAGDVVVTAMSFGAGGSLAYRYDGAGFHALDVPPRAFDDMTATALGNSTLAEVLADGSALVVHQFLSPRAFRVWPDGRVEALRVPTPDGTRGRIANVPSGPATELRLGDMLIPASAMSVDRSGGDVYVLTRTGRLRDERQERALLRLDDRLGLVESYTLGFHALRMAVLPRAGVLLMVDDEDRFHACDLRSGNGHARVD